MPATRQRRSAGTVPGTLARVEEDREPAPVVAEPDQLGEILPALDPGSRARIGAGLQAHGNAYVQHLARRAAAGAVLQRDKTKGKAPAPPPREYTIDADGFLSAADAAGQTSRVGYAGGTGPAYVCVSGSETGVPVAAAELGKLDPGGPVVSVREATVEREGESASGAGPVKVTAKGPTLGVRYDAATSAFGERVLQKGKAWEPIVYDKIAPTLQAILTQVPEAHLELTTGTFWALMEFTLKGDTKPRRVWAVAKDKELAQARKTVEKDMESMPDDLQKQVEEYIGTITSVMAHEGSYGARSPGDDYMASIGIFQWGMHKNKKSEAGSSMGKFFLNLKTRATPPAGGAKPTPEQQLYIDAWAQCTKHGIDVSATGVVSVNGKAATGKQIEDMLSGNSGEMATGALRKYQLVAAKDWVQEFAANPVRPGPSFTSWLGHGYSEPKSSPQGVLVNLTYQRGTTKYTFDLTAPSGSATVGSTFPTQKNVALAVTLGANRPHYVEAALWRALTGKDEAKGEVATLLGAIVDAREKAQPPAADAGKKPKAKPKKSTVAVTADEAASWNAQSQYADLLRIVWPATKSLDAAAEEKMATEFKKEGLALYNKKDAEKYKRWRRFSTVEAAFD